MLFSIIFPLVQQSEQQAWLTILPDLTLPALCYHPLPPLPHPVHADFCTVPRTHSVASLFWLELLFLFLPNNLLSPTFFVYLCLRAETSIRCFCFQRLPWVPRKKWPYPSLCRHCPFIRILGFTWACRIMKNNTCLLFWGELSCRKSKWVQPGI